VITEADIRRYTEGQCWVLAWHIKQEAPAQHQVRIMDLDEHVLVQLGDEDRYLDVNGIQTKDQLRKTWRLVDLLEPIRYDLTQHILPDQDHPENVRAREVARLLIAQHLQPVA
jgi:hypothetical protein